MTSYDVAIIGSGPGGYVAAIRCAQLGFKTALIERYNTLGGTCLNVGCIPSKALLDSSEHYHNAHTNFKEHGIDVQGAITPNFAQMVARKNKVVADTCNGINFLMNKNKVTCYTGHASFVNLGTIAIAKNDGTTEQIQATKTIIATGSKPIVPPAFNYDKKRIITSTEALSLPEIPKSITIVGAGVIGLELGSVYARLGTQVHVVEYLDRTIATMDKDLSKELTRTLKKLGFTFHFNHAVQSVTSDGNQTTLTATPRNGGDTLTLQTDYCLVAIGRKPYTDKLGLENIGITLDEKGRIPVNEHLQTTAEGVYAIGDVIAGPMLAHKAEEEGTFVAETIANQHPHINYNLIPGVVYTWPEVAAVGKTEDELIAQQIPYKVGKFPIKALGRARASMDTEGFVKMLAHKETDEILGCHLIAPRAADLIADMVTAMEYRASAEDISRTSHAHPTYAEAIKEAALAATDNRPIHI
jgi:dihydrolipoamide dehydrogenase